MDEEIWRLFRLWGILHHTVWAIARNRQNELNEVGTTLMQAALMVIVKTIDGPVTPSVISRWLFREPQSVSSLLDHMEKKGVIKRVRDLDRRNKVRVVLTDVGEEIYRSSLEKTVTLREIMSSLTEEEQANLEKYLLKLRSKALSELGAKPSLATPVVKSPTT